MAHPNGDGTPRRQEAVAARPRLKPTLEMEDLLYSLDPSASRSLATVSSRCDLLSPSRSQDAIFHLAHARARAENETSSPAGGRLTRLLLPPRLSRPFDAPLEPPLVSAVADRRCSCLPAGAAPLHVLRLASATVCLRG
jgi:hypothetical protein